MKKLSLLAIVALGVSFASCKKDYTCTCSYSPGSGSATIKIKAASKGAAQANCVSGTRTSTGSYVSTCTLSK